MVNDKGAREPRYPMLLTRLAQYVAASGTSIALVAQIDPRTRLSMPQM